MNNVYHIPSRDEAPRDYPIRINVIRTEVSRSLFTRFCDASADLIATCAEHPGHAYFLIFLGQSSVVLAALAWVLA